MSHTAKMKTSIKNPEALRRALLRMPGITANRIEICDKAKQCHGYHEEEQFNANVILRRKNSKAWGGCDVGWELQADGTYLYHGDSFDYDEIGQHYDTDWHKKVNTLYNVECSKMELDAQGIAYEETQDQQGRTVIEARFELPESNRFQNN